MTPAEEAHAIDRLVIWVYQEMHSSFIIYYRGDHDVDSRRS
nr:MAG TPA: hypothetical protein [Bacteriophage sp.]